MYESQSAFSVLRIILGIWCCVVCVASIAWSVGSATRPYWRDGGGSMGLFQGLLQDREEERTPEISWTPLDLEDHGGQDLTDPVALEHFASLMPCSEHFRSRLGSNFGSNRPPQAAHNQFSLNGRPKAADHADMAGWSSSSHQPKRDPILRVPSPDRGASELLSQTKLRRLRGTSLWTRREFGQRRRPIEPERAH